MKFEILNEKNKVVMQTRYSECIPVKETIDTMVSAGYKFKLNNKIIPKKKLEEMGGTL